MTRHRATVAVAGAGATNVKATVAANLAVGFASLGLVVDLNDADPLHHAATALTGVAAPRVRVEKGGPLEIRATTAETGAGDASSPDVVVIDCAPRLDSATRDAVASSQAVVVGVDGSALSLRALDELARVRSEAGGVILVLLTRGLPRSVDRWALVESLAERDDVVLSPITVPTGRAARPQASDGASGRAEPRPRRATLYAPTTNAARAYAATAARIAGELALGAR